MESVIKFILNERSIKKKGMRTILLARKINHIKILSTPRGVVRQIFLPFRAIVVKVGINKGCTALNYSVMIIRRSKDNIIIKAKNKIKK